MQDENSVMRESRVKLTGHLAVYEFELVQPLNALRFELGQIGFGFLRFGVVLLALGFNLLVILCAVLEGSCGKIALLVRVGLGQKSPLKIFLQSFVEGGAPFDIILQSLDLGLAPLFFLLELGLGGRELIFQLQVLKDEQLEKLAALIMRFLQKQPG